MRVDLDERKIDFELIGGGSKTGIGERGASDAGGARKDGRSKKSADASSSRARETVSDDVRKSREIKKALLSDAKAGKPSKSKPKRSGAKPKATGKGAPKSEGAAPRKRKTKP